MRVLALEPYYGGSHRQFLDQWAERSGHRFTVLGLPAHKWKWRMRHAAITFSAELERRVAGGETWDLLLCSDMLPLAELKGLAPDPVRVLPAVIYFHENQITYPVRHEQERDYHFGLTNFASALAADEVWFNSAFHRLSFLEALPTFLRKMPDYRPMAAIEQLRRASRVEHPGVEDPSLSADAATSDDRLHILWAARWEFDKDPETFFRALERLDRSQEFRLSVLGESFRNSPAIFAEARERWSDRIGSWGFLGRSDYLAALRRADVVVSTAQHEYFGLGVVEAMLAGAEPLLPWRLSYPELVGASDGDGETGCRDAGRDAESFLYRGGAGTLARRLRGLMARKASGELRRDAARELAEPFLWSVRQPALDAGLERVAALGRGISPDGC